MFENINYIYCYLCEIRNCNGSEPIVDRRMRRGNSDRVSDELHLFNDDICCHTCDEFDCDCMEPVLNAVSAVNQIAIASVCKCDDCHQAKCICDDLS